MMLSASPMTWGSEQGTTRCKKQLVILLRGSLERVGKSDVVTRVVRKAQALKWAFADNAEQTDCRKLADARGGGSIVGSGVASAGFLESERRRPQRRDTPAISTAGGRHATVAASRRDVLGKQAR